MCPVETDNSQFLSELQEGVGPILKVLVNSLGELNKILNGWF